VSKPRNQEPPANEFGKIRSLLARNGVSQADITAVIVVFFDDKARVKADCEGNNDERQQCPTDMRVQIEKTVDGFFFSVTNHFLAT